MMDIIWISSMLITSLLVLRSAHKDTMGGGGERGDERTMGKIIVILRNSEK